MFTHPPKSICVLRLSAIGDVCNAVAAIQAIQAQWPDTKMTWVVGKAETTLLAGLDSVEFIVFDKSKGYRAYIDLRKQCRNRKFDVLLHMQSALRASVASLFISAKTKVGFDFERATEGQWFFSKHKIQAQKRPHVLDGFMGFVHKLGLAVPTVPTWSMPIDAEHRMWAQTVLADKRTAIISPAASKTERNWHSVGYAKVAEYLVSLGFQVLVCGGVSVVEKALGREIEKNCRVPFKSLIGKTDLKQLLALIESSQLLISPDSGPVHMAVSVNTPVVGLYAQSNPQRTGPYLYLDYVVDYYPEAIKNALGKEFAHIPWGTRVKGELMHNIRFEDVKEKIDLLLKIL